MTNDTLSGTAKPGLYEALQVLDETREEQDKTVWEKEDKELQCAPTAPREQEESQDESAEYEDLKAAFAISLGEDGQDEDEVERLAIELSMQEDDDENGLRASADGSSTSSDEPPVTSGVVDDPTDKISLERQGGVAGARKAKAKASKKTLVKPNSSEDVDLITGPKAIASYLEESGTRKQDTAIGSPSSRYDQYEPQTHPPAACHSLAGHVRSRWER
jgi:hypothetical protein